MTEKSWWSNHIKPRWHRPQQRWVSWKVQDAYNGGLPDTDSCFKGTEAKVELKYLAAWPVRPDTLVSFSTYSKEERRPSIVSATQHRHLQAWHEAGGNAFVLCGIGKEWLLLCQGGYENVPMTKAQLIEVAVFTYLAEAKTDKLSYDSLSDIPPLIMEHYGKRRFDPTQLINLP